jgi:Transglycosylase SLT domain
VAFEAATIFARLRINSDLVKTDTEKGLAAASSGTAAKKAGESAGKQFGSGFSSSLKSMLTMGVGLLGVGAALGGIKEIISGGAALQKSTVLLTAAEQAHGLAVKANTPLIQAATVMGAKYGQTQDTIQNSLVKLINAGVPLSEALKVQQAALNVSAVTGQDYADVLAKMTMGGGTAARTLKALGVTQATGATQAKALEAASKLLNDRIAASGGLANFAAQNHLTLAQAHTLVSGALAGNISDYNKLNIEVLPKSATLAQNLAQAQAILNAKYGKEGVAATQTWAGVQKQLLAALKDMAATIGVAVLPYLTAMAQKLISVVQWLQGSSSGAVLVREAFKTLGAVLRTAGDDLRTITGWLTSSGTAATITRDALIGIGGAILVITGVTKAIALWNGAMNVLSAMMSTTTVKVVAWAVTQSASLIETTALWVMYTLGVTSAGVATAIATGGIILIVAALVVGIYELYKHWNTVWSFIKKISMDVFNWLKANWPLVLAILVGPIGIAALEIYKHWDTIKRAFSDAIAFITKIVGTVGHVIEAAFTTALGVVSRLATTVGDAIAAPFITGFNKITQFVSSNFDKWWAQNGAALKQLWGDVWLGMQVVFHRIWDPLLVVLRTGWTVIQAVFTAGSAVIRGIWDTMWSVTTTVARAGWIVIQALFTAGSAVLRAVWTAAWDVITTAARTGWAVIQALFTAGMAVVKAVWQAGWVIVSTIFSVAWLAIQAAWRIGWTVIENVLKVAWAAVEAVVKTAWDIIVGLFTVFLQLITGHWSAAWNTVTTVASQVWNNIRGLFSTFCNALVTVISTTLGTVVGFFQGLGARISSAVSNLAGLLVGAGQAVINGLFNGIKAVWDTVVGWFKGLPGKILSALGIASPPRWAIDAGTHIMNGILGSLTKGAKDVKAFFVGLATSVTGPLKSIWGSISSVGKSIWHAVFGGGGSGVAQWAGLVSQALAMEGLPQSLAAQVLYQMQTESGGDPNAQNNTDINAQMGIPSQGLLQVIPPTFALYHWPGTSSNIRDPLANIAAAINYARARYGPTLMSGGQGMGSGHGYAEGTPSARKGWAWVGEHGVPELVNFSGGEQVGPWAGGSSKGSDPQLAAIAGLLGKLIDTTAQVPAGVGRHVGGAIGGSASDAAFRSRYPHSGW